MKHSGTTLTFFSIFILLISSAIGVQAENNDSAEMLTPVILTLVISEENKNNPDAIAVAQDRVLESLKTYHVDNIRRYRYTPLLSLSVDQAGLDMLEHSDEISAISADSLNAPHVNRPSGDIPEKTKSPCNRKAK